MSTTFQFSEKGKLGGNVWTGSSEKIRKLVVRIASVRIAGESVVRLVEFGVER
jgi:hypothetical protein